MTDSLSDTATTAWARLVRAQQTALKSVEAELKHAGFPPLAWYDVLLELERAADGRLRPRDIQKHMLLERYSVTRLVERMEKDGLVARLGCADDGRGAVVRITQKGRRLRRKMWPVYAAAIEQSFAGRFDDGELATLSGLLGRLLMI